MYEIGILGGMGPRATAMLFQQIVDSTPAHTDQEHLNIAMVSKSKIPDRSAYLLGQSAESPLPALLEGIRELDNLEAKVILLPCNTAHHFYSQLADSSQGYVLNMVRNALHYISASDLPKKVYVLGTLGTVKTQIYDRNNHYDLSICYPNDASCRKLHRIIYEVKEQNAALSELARDLDAVIEEIRQEMGQVTFAVACTELSCLFPFLQKKDGVVDVMDLSALAAVSLFDIVPISAENYDVSVLCAVAKEDFRGK